MWILKCWRFICKCLLLEILFRWLFQFFTFFKLFNFTFLFFLISNFFTFLYLKRFRLRVILRDLWLTRAMHRIIFVDIFFFMNYDWLFFIIILTSLINFTIIFNLMIFMLWIDFQFIWYIIFFIFILDEIKFRFIWWWVSSIKIIF